MLKHGSIKILFIYVVYLCWARSYHSDNKINKNFLMSSIWCQGGGGGLSRHLLKIKSTDTQCHPTITIACLMVYEITILMTSFTLSSWHFAFFSTLARPLIPSSFVKITELFEISSVSSIDHRYCAEHAMVRDSPQGCEGCPGDPRGEGRVEGRVEGFGEGRGEGCGLGVPPAAVRDGCLLLHYAHRHDSCLHISL